MTYINPAIFKAYDIRATYPTDINEEVVARVMESIYNFFSNKTGKTAPSIALGRDMRISSPALYKVASDTLARCGAHVIDLGLVPTTTIYFTVLSREFDAGIQISASHNPKEYNGVKMVLRNGSKLVKIGRNTGMPDIKSWALGDDEVQNKVPGDIQLLEGMIKEEVSTAINIVPSGDLTQLKIVVDPANAMGIPLLTELFSQLGVQFVPMYFELDGTFPNHQADPLQYKTMHDLQEKVKEVSASIGITTDGDADRVMFVDEKGDIIPATFITALVAGEILKENPGEKILVDIRYIRNVENMVKKLGGEIGYTKVGHALITEQLNNEGANFAGESSGHYYFQDVGGCESSVRVILYALRVLARENKPISEIISAMKTSVESGELNYTLAPGVKVEDIISEIKQVFNDGNENNLDGVAIDYHDWRFSIRTSNTEPLLRLNIEGINEIIVGEKLKILSDIILKTGSTLID